LSSLDETDSGYSIAPTDDLQVSFTAGCRGGEDIHVYAGVSKSVKSLFVLYSYTAKQYYRNRLNTNNWTLAETTAICHENE